MEWRDATDYAHGERGEIQPLAWEVQLLKSGEEDPGGSHYKLKVWRRRGAATDFWYMSCFSYVGYISGHVNEVPLGNLGDDHRAAQQAGLKWLRNSISVNLDAMSRVLASIKELSDG